MVGRKTTVIKWDWRKKKNLRGRFIGFSFCVSFSKAGISCQLPFWLLWRHFVYQSNSSTRAIVNHCFNNSISSTRAIHRPGQFVNHCFNNSILLTKAIHRPGQFVDPGNSSNIISTMTFCQQEQFIYQRNLSTMAIRQPGPFVNLGNWSTIVSTTSFCWPKQFVDQGNSSILLTKAIGWPGHLSTRGIFHPGQFVDNYFNNAILSTRAIRRPLFH